MKVHVEIENTKTLRLDLGIGESAASLLDALVEARESGADLKEMKFYSVTELGRVPPNDHRMRLMFLQSKTEEVLNSERSAT